MDVSDILSPLNEAQREAVCATQEPLLVLISGGRPVKAFDIYTDRKLSYALRDGAPDPDVLPSNSTWSAWPSRLIGLRIIDTVDSLSAMISVI